LYALNDVVFHAPESNNSFVKSEARLARCGAYDAPRDTLYDLRVTKFTNLRRLSMVVVYLKTKIGTTKAIDEKEEQ
jgi:hypothetical protein